MLPFLALTLGVVLFLLSIFPASAASPAAVLERAIAAVEQGRYTEGLTLLGSLPATSLSPQERKRARYLQGHASLKLKRLPDALYAFGEVVEQYPELADYALWNIARLYKEVNAERFQLEALRLLLGRFPESRLVPQSRLALARELIGATGEFANGVQLLEAFLSEHAAVPRIAEVYLLLGQGYEGLGAVNRAIDTYRTLYIRFPASAEADQGLLRLEALLTREQRPPMGLAPHEQLERADYLALAGACERAIQEVRGLSPDSLTDDLRSRATARLGLCAFKLRRYREAATILEKFRQAFFTDERASEVLYNLGLSYQRDSRPGEAEQTLRQLAVRTPLTPWNAKALAGLGSMYEARQDTERACEVYAELVSRFPTDERADELAWRIGWLRYGQRLFSAAGRDFAAAAERFPQSIFVSNARYWQAKALEKSGTNAHAMTLYERVAREYPYSYYGIRAEEIMRARAALGSPLPNGLSPTTPLSHGEPSPRFTSEPLPSPQATFHRVRIDELLALRFLEDAREEVGQLAKRLGGEPAEQMLLADLYLKVGLPLQGIRVLNASLSAVDPTERLVLPINFWMMLFPQLYWDEVRETAKRVQLDPFLLLGVIRQESAFNTHAVSRSDARGLMQVLPSTGRELFHRSGLGTFQVDLLFDPRINVSLGAQYLQRLAGAHQGNVILTLAAYNAGPTRVKRWLQEISRADWDEFIESLPFEETRAYIKNVLRNYGVYRKLYAEKG